MTVSFPPDIVRHHHERDARGAFFALALAALSGFPVATVEAWTDDEIDAPRRPYRPVRFINTDPLGRALDVTGVHEGSTFLAGPALAKVRKAAFDQGAQRLMLGVRFFGPTLLVGGDPVFGRPFGKAEAVRIENAKRQIRANKPFLAEVGRRRAQGAKDVHLPYYTHGAAYAYALALARLRSDEGGASAPILSIEGVHAPSGQPWLHAGLLGQDGLLLDAWGAVSLDDVVRRYALTEVRTEEETYQQVMDRFSDQAEADRFADYIAQEAGVMQANSAQPLSEQNGKKGFRQPAGGAFWRVLYERQSATPGFEVGATSPREAQRQPAMIGALSNGTIDPSPAGSTS